MGAICNPSNGSGKSNLKPVTQEEIDKSVCKQLIYEYLQFYGKQVSMPLINWIDSSFDKDYTSNISYFHYPSAVYLKRDLSSAFETVHNGGWTARLDKFIKISTLRNQELIVYEMTCNGPKAPNSFERVDVRYKVISAFTAERRFKTSIFRQIT